MTQPTYDQFRVDGRRIEHVPTGACIEFQPKRFWERAQCEISVGAADCDLPNGDRYRMCDILELAWQLMARRAPLAA